MPSYAHYYQTLIPHMPVPPGSIHLHTHSPSVLTSPSGSRQQAGSGSLRARSWCWTLSGRKHFPANSFTWKELLTGLTTCFLQPQSSLTRREDIHKFSPSLLWPVRHAQSSTAWPQQPIGKNKQALPQQVQQSRDSLTVSVSGWYEVFLQRSPGFTLRRSGPNGEDPLTRFISAIIFACTRVDTCHPGNCMRSTACIPFARSLPCQELRIK
jgi:hypothetical protein